MSRFFQNIEQCLSTVDTVTLGIGGLLHDSMLFEPLNCALRGREGQVQLIGCASDSDEWIGGQQIENPKRRIGRVSGQRVVPLCEQIVEARRSAERIFRHACNALEKVFQPFVLCTSRAHAAQAVVVVPASGFKESGEIKQRCRENLPFDQK